MTTEKISELSPGYLYSDFTQEFTCHSFDAIMPLSFIYNLHTFSNC